MSPKLRSLLARVALVGGGALVATYVARSAPHDQTIAIGAGSRDLERLTGVITRAGDDEPTVGFSVSFPTTSPRTIRHTFSAPNGTYIVVITLAERSGPSGNGGNVTGDLNPIPTETTFERRVSLVGGEVIVSPD
jgi:hypothetical protein